MKPANRRRFKHFLLACGLLILLATTTAWCGLTLRADGAPGTTRAVRIPRGASRTAIITTLHDAGFAPWPALTELAFRATGTFRHIRAGNHVLPADAHTLDLIDHFKTQYPDDHVVVRIIPGRSLWEHARVLEELGISDPGELLEVANDSAFLSTLGVPLSTAPPPNSVPLTAPDPARPPTFLLEGYLFPETWHLNVRATVRDVVTRAVDAFRTSWQTLASRHAAPLAAIRREFGLSDHQLVILASLVQKEMVVAAEAPIIAGVFYNRLRAGWKLETDPTLMYRADRVGRAPTPAERRDASNPYNTYAFKGLPPGPIANPGRAALEGVMNPTPTDFMFFVARRDGTGEHAFARDLETHRANIERYLRRREPSP
jgi:UPF0755 protein